MIALLALLLGLLGLPSAAHGAGELDPTFDGDGRVVADFGALDFARGVAIQADGKIVAAGFSGAGANPFNFVLARFNPDGSLDPTFDGDGRVVTDFGTGDGALSVAIQADGKIVAAGFSDAGDNPSNFALARYLAGPVNLPPDCSTVSANPNALWPPNHRLGLVTLSGATDPDGDAVTLTITAVTQDEPSLNGEGDGNSAPDAKRASAASEVFLRAERSGRGDGRVYHIAFTGSNGKGGTCEGTATVAVALSRTSKAVDSAPPSFDSFGS